MSGRDDPELYPQLLALLMRQVPTLHWVVDRDLRVISAGGPVEEILGYPPDRWIGSTFYDVQAADGAIDQGILAHQRALAGEVATYTNVYRDKHMQVTVGPYRTNGEIVGAIGTSFDITPFQMLEKRMVDAQRAESLGVLAGGLAHDFNNLLVAIIGNADLGLRDTRPGAPGHAALENIRNAGLRAAELTDQLLAYAGRGGGGATTRVEPRGLVEELLRISAPTLPANVQIAVDIPDGLAMRGDPAQVRQVFLNLLGNARDAVGSRGGHIAVNARVLHCTGDRELDDVLTPGKGRYVELAISDDGPGIDGETRRRIFEPFFTTKSTGHGIGLAAVLGIVRSNGGGLRLVSSPDRGARFEVLWPAAATPTELPIVTPTIARTVLVIDDEDLVRDVVARMIQDLGYAALTAADGPTALEIVERETVDAVLVDLTMPRMSGADVVTALRQRRPTLPVVLCTGYDRDRRGPVRADAYLPKPFRIDALEKTLAKILQVP